MKKLNVFQLDDDHDQLRLFEAVCAQEDDFEFKGYDNAKDFLLNIKEEEPDVCIIDLNLKEGRGAGFAVLEAIRNKFSNDLPVFILSRRNDTKDISNAFELGVTDYILKPIDPLLISEKIKTFLIPKYNSRFPAKQLEDPIKGVLKLNLKFLTLNDTYIVLEADHFFMKQSKLELSHPLIKKIFRKDEMEFLVHECELHEKTGRYLLTMIAVKDNQQYYDDLHEFIMKERR